MLVRRVCHFSVEETRRRKIAKARSQPSRDWCSTNRDISKLPLRTLGPFLKLNHRAALLSLILAAQPWNYRLSQSHSRLTWASTFQGDARAVLVTDFYARTHLGSAPSTSPCISFAPSPLSFLRSQVAHKLRKQSIPRTLVKAPKR